MINSKNQKNFLITPEKAASFIPVFISSGISILLIIFFVIPQYFKSTKVNSELSDLIKKKNELGNLKSQYKIINRKFDKFNKEKSKLIELITGTTNLDTLLTQLGQIGRKHNIQFISIVPKKVIIAVEDKKDKTEKNKNKNLKQIDSINDPLFVAGIKKYLIDFTFTTDFVNLISFLRELEAQENVILFNDINLSSSRQEIVDGEIDKSFKMLEVKISITFYGKT